MGAVRTTYLIDENGIIVLANDKVKAAADLAKNAGESVGFALFIRHFNFFSGLLLSCGYSSLVYVGRF